MKHNDSHRSLLEENRQTSGAFTFLSEAGLHTQNGALSIWRELNLRNFHTNRPPLKSLLDSGVQQLNSSNKLGWSGYF